MDCREGLKQLEDDSIDCCITSPPYWSLRDYGIRPSIWDGDPDCDHDWNEFIKRGMSEGLKSEKVQIKAQINFQITPDSKHSFCSKCNAWRGVLGLEPNFELYIKHLCDIYDQVKRVLKPTGTCWVNLGDTYGGHKGEMRNPGYKDKEKGIQYRKDAMGPKENFYLTPKKYEKCLLMIPQRFAIEMVNRGWILRNVIIWHKSNCMPSCLKGDTRIFVKNKINGFIKQIQLQDLNKDEYLILTPNGWKEVIDIWKTKKKAWKIKTNRIEEITCSGDHRFAISHDKRRKIIHFIETKNIRFNTSKDKFIYSNLSQFLNDGKIKRIDIINTKKIDWFADISDIEIEETPLELAKKCNDASLRKYNYENTWVYASDTHNELRRKKIRIHRIKHYDFNKVSANKSPKFENRFYDLDYDLGWLIGLYIAEGGFNQPRGFQAKITLNRNEINIAKKFRELFSNKFGIETNKINKNKNYLDFTFSSACFYALTKCFLVKGKCSTKHLDINFLLNTPKEFRQGIIDGYILGDGYERDKQKTVTSASKLLIKNIQTIWASIGELTSFGKNEQYDKRTKKKYHSWSLWTNQSYKFNDRNLAYIFPKDFTQSNEIIEMIDIKVDGGEFLIENGLISHNSARDRFTVDFEYVYFFVKSNKTQYWINEKTRKSISTKPLGTKGIEGIDWEWRKCEKCLGTGIKHKKCKFCVETGWYYDELLRPRKCPKCRGLGRIRTDSECKSCKGKGVKKYNFWKGKQYWFEQQRTPHQSEPHQLYAKKWNSINSISRSRSDGSEFYNSLGRNMRTVWKIPTKPNPEAHFATFPPDLVIPMIKSGCPEFICKMCGKPREKIIESIRPKDYEPLEWDEKHGEGCGGQTFSRNRPLSKIFDVALRIKQEFKGYSDCGCGVGFKSGVALDHFTGTGTTLLTAWKLGMNYIGFEISKEYCKIANKNLSLTKNIRLDDFIYGKQIEV